jgi:hypothetical protein
MEIYKKLTATHQTNTDDQYNATPRCVAARERLEEATWMHCGADCHCD